MGLEGALRTEPSNQLTYHVVSVVAAALRDAARLDSRDAPLSRGSSEAERRAHNPDVVGASPAPATSLQTRSWSTGTLGTAEVT